MSATDKFQAQQYLSNGGILANFMPASQRFALREALKGEEGEYFADLVKKLVWRIKGMPVTYNTEDVATPDKVLHLHYFKGGVDAWIVERDVGDTPGHNGEGEQIQAYGKITLCGDGWEGAEWGYISIAELIEAGVELDLYWTETTAKEMERGG